MSGEFEREDTIEEIIIDYSSRVPGARRKGSKNPTHKDIEKATQDFLDQGGKIDIHIPEWTLEAFMNLPIGTNGADTWLMS